MTRSRCCGKCPPRIWLLAVNGMIGAGIFGDTPGSFRVPGGWFTALGAFLVSGLLLLQVQADAVWVTAGFLLAGAVIHAWTARYGRAGGDPAEASSGRPVE